jgi:hypothetical protein
MDKGIGVELATTRSSIDMRNSVEVDDDEFESKEASLLRIVETFLRLFPIGLCVTALVIMLKNSEQNEYGSVAYSDLGAFRYQSSQSVQNLYSLRFFYKKKLSQQKLLYLNYIMNQIYLCFSNGKYTIFR